MKHYASTAFWNHYQSLPESVRKLADKNFKLLKINPSHPSLHFKKVGKYRTVRIGLFCGVNHTGINLITLQKSLRGWKV